MDIKESKIVELEKRIEKLQSYVSLLEKHIQVDIRGIVLTVDNSVLSITADNIILHSSKNLNIVSGQSTQIYSGATIDIESNSSLDIKSAMVHIN